MGCSESRCWSQVRPDGPIRTSMDRLEEDADEAEALLDPQTAAVHEEEDNEHVTDRGTRPPVGRPVENFAQRVSEDIVTQALRLCWEVEKRHMGLPFIDSEYDYII